MILLMLNMIYSQFFREPLHGETCLHAAAINGLLEMIKQMQLRDGDLSVLVSISHYRIFSHIS
jgi:hypothetical protein